mgnify:FL=1
MLKILIAAEFILISAVLVLSMMECNEMPTAYAVKEIENRENSSFKLFIKAVCEEKAEHIFCSDELFIECNGKELIVTKNNMENFAECGGAALNLSDNEVIGSAVFEKKWVDPRKNG